MRVTLIKPGYGRKKGAPMDVTPDKAFVMMTAGFVEKDHRWMAKRERVNPKLSFIRKRLAPDMKKPPQSDPDPDPPGPATAPEDLAPGPEEKPKPKKKRRGRPRKKKTKAAETEEKENA